MSSSRFWSLSLLTTYTTAMMAIMPRKYTTVRVFGAAMMERELGGTTTPSRLAHVAACAYEVKVWLVVFKMASASSLHSLISKIYSAGVEAVRPASLVRQALKIESITDTLHVDGRQYQLKRYKVSARILMILILFAKNEIGM